MGVMSLTPHLLAARYVNFYPRFGGGVAGACCSITEPPNAKCAPQPPRLQLDSYYASVHLLRGGLRFDAQLILGRPGHRDCRGCVLYRYDFGGTVRSALTYHPSSRARGANPTPTPTPNPTPNPNPNTNPNTLTQGRDSRATRCGRSVLGARRLRPQL